MNLPPSSIDAPVYTLSSSDLDPVMNTFHSQLRLLLGLSPSLGSRKHPFIDLINYSFVPSTSRGIAEWELDSSIRARTLHYTEESIKTLQGLSKLIKTMTHMAVKESVKESTDAALEQLRLVRGSMSLTPPDLDAALLHAQLALKFSEKAFFDPSMVPQMYFPEKNIFAVYSPLVMPLVIPVARGAVIEFKRLRWRSDITIFYDRQVLSCVTHVLYTSPSNRSPITPPPLPCTALDITTD